MGTVAARVDFCEFSAQEEELRRIVDPHEKQNDAPRGAIRGFKADPYQVEGDQLFSDGEEQRSDGGSDGNVAPVEPDIGDQFVDGREEQCYDNERSYKFG